jgi:hypothetical protein
MTAWGISQRILSILKTNNARTQSSTPPELTEGQAMYVVTRLIEDRRVSPAKSAGM